MKNVQALHDAVTGRLSSGLADADDPFFGVMARGYLAGTPVNREPWGPFKNAADAADFLDYKRRQHGPNTLGRFGDGNFTPEHDGQLFCHPLFTYDLIHTSEFYATIGAQLAQVGLALMAAAATSQKRPDAVGLKPVPKVGKPMLVPTLPQKQQEEDKRYFETRNVDQGDPTPPEDILA